MNVVTSAFHLLKDRQGIADLQGKRIRLGHQPSRRIREIRDRKLGIAGRETDGMDGIAGIISRADFVMLSIRLGAEAPSAQAKVALASSTANVAKILISVPPTLRGILVFSTGGVASRLTYSQR